MSTDTQRIINRARNFVQVLLDGGASRWSEQDQDIVVPLNTDGEIMETTGETTKSYCNECLQETNHDLIATRHRSWVETADDGTPVHEESTDYDFVQCRGCENVSLRRRHIGLGEHEESVDYFPPAVSRRLPGWLSGASFLDWDGPKMRIRGLLGEVYSALFSGSNRLAMMGARAVVDIALTDKLGDVGGFAQKLDEAEKRGWVPDGKLPEDTFWYEPDVVEDQPLFDPKGGWERIEKSRRWMMSQIHRLPYGEDVEDLLIRYTAALGQPNLDVAFLFMWNILERLTDTVGGPYDTTIRRTVWPFEDRSLASGLLDTLRCRRNLFVHAARSSNDRNEAAYLVKSFIDPHLVRLCHNQFGVGSLNEYGRCLDLPTHTKALEQQRRWLGKALRMQKGGTKSNEH